MIGTEELVELPSHAKLQAIRQLALRLGGDPDTIDRALMNYLASFDPVRRNREPGEDDE